MEKIILGKIQETINGLDPDAEVYIFGSQARETATDESDWDVLVITTGPLTREFKRRIRHALYEIEWDHGCAISSIIHSREEWSSPRMKMTPFYNNVIHEAVRL